MSSLSLASTSDNGRAVIALDGELDLATVPNLREAALGALDDPQTTTLVLDLAKLTFLDSTGIGCWIELRNRAEDTGKQLELHAMPSAARRTVTIAGLDSVFGLNA